jgi:hypothetical protein
MSFLLKVELIGVEREERAYQDGWLPSGSERIPVKEQARPADLLLADTGLHAYYKQPPGRGRAQADAGVGVVEDEAVIDFDVQRADPSGVNVFGGRVMFLVVVGQATEDEAGNKLIEQVGQFVREHRGFLLG